MYCREVERQMVGSVESNTSESEDKEANSNNKTSLTA